MSVTLDPVEYLPRDISLETFSYLEIPDLGRCCQVSSKWRILASDNAIWDKYAKNLFIGGIPKSMHIKSFLQEFNATRCLTSNDEIIDRIQAFTNRISLGENGRFRCILGLGPRYKMISIEIKSNRSDHFDINEAYLSKTDIIGNGSLTTPPISYPNFKISPLNSGREISLNGATITQHISSNFYPQFQSTLKFPKVQPFLIPVTPQFQNGPPLESRTIQILEIKTYQLAQQKQCCNSILIMAALGTILLSLYMFFLTTTSD